MLRRVANNIRFFSQRPPFQARPNNRSNGRPILNDKIRALNIRLIGPDGENLGITATRVALDQARQKNLDLVLFDKNRDPQVCKMMDYNKHVYDQRRIEKGTKKPKPMKEVQFGVLIEDHDCKIKMERARKFLAKGNPVRLCLTWRRNTFYKLDRGKQIFSEVFKEIEQVGKQDGSQIVSRNNIAVIFSPLTKSK